MSRSLCNRTKVGILLSVLIIATVGIGLSIPNYDNLIQAPWNSTKPRDPSGDNCEANLPTNKILRQPWNALSSLAFLMPATILFTFFVFDIKSRTKLTHMSKHPTFTFISGWANLLHCIGTTLNHACACTIGWMLDDFFALQTVELPAMYLFCIHIEKFRTVRKLPLYFRNAIAFVLMIILNGVLSFGKVFGVPGVMGSVFLIFVSAGFVMIPAVVFAYKDKKMKGEIGYLWTAAVLYVLGIISAAIDGIACTSNKTFGSHVIWHILGSFSLTFLNMYIWTIKEVDLKNEVEIDTESTSEVSAVDDQNIPEKV